MVVRVRILFGVILFLLAIGSSAGEATQVDSDTLAFATYISDVSRLDGMYHGLADFCRQYVPALILSQSDAAWHRNNGRYIDSIDLAIQRYASAKVDAARRDQVVQQLKTNAQTWFQEAHDKSNVLSQVQIAEEKSTACSGMLGTMVSDSFYLKRMMPEDDAYWLKYLNP